MNDNDNDLFISGCLDKIIRIWSIKRNKVVDYINIKEYITALSYFPTGDMVAVGTHNGRCSIYDCKPKLKYNFSFTCRNRIGRFALGRKITNIDFVNRTQAVITTNDSRVRLVSMFDGKLIQKYKGIENEEYMIRAFADDGNDMVICASEDGNVLVWNRLNKECPNQKKNYYWEFFKPFNKENSTCSFFVDERTKNSYMQKFFNIGSCVFINSIIINVSISGKLQVLLNCDEIQEKQESWAHI